MSASQATPLPITLTALLVAGLLACEIGVGYPDDSFAPGEVDGASAATVDASAASPDATSPDTTDAGSGPSGDAAVPDAAPTDCDEQVSPVGDGYHYQGAPCLPCHDRSYGSLPAFTIAGTLYSDSSGSDAVPGATIRAIDDDGRTINMITTNNGNFWSTESVAFPVTVRASMCPDTRYMPEPVAASGADCSSCHSSGSRMHLP